MRKRMTLPLGASVEGDVPLHTAMLAYTYHRIDVILELAPCHVSCLLLLSWQFSICQRTIVYLPGECLLHQADPCLLSFRQLLDKMPCSPLSHMKTSSGQRKKPARRWTCALAGAAWTAGYLAAAVQVTLCFPTAAGATAQRRQCFRRHRLRRLCGPVVHAQPGGAAPGVRWPLV